MAGFLGTWEAVLGRAEAVRAPPLHEKMHVLVCTLLESFCPLPAGASWISFVDAAMPDCLAEFKMPQAGRLKQREDLASLAESKVGFKPARTHFAQVARLGRKKGLPVALSACLPTCLPPLEQLKSALTNALTLCRMMTKKSKNTDRWTGSNTLAARNTGKSRCRHLLHGWLHVEDVLTAPLFYDLSGANSKTYGKHALKRRRALYRVLEEVPAQEWDKVLSCYNIIPASKKCTDQEWSCRFGQVFMAVLQHGDTCHIIVDFQIYHNTNESRSKSYHKDILKGCFIEALLYHCNTIEGFADTSVVCLAFPVESQLFLDEILPDRVGLSHSAHFCLHSPQNVPTKASQPMRRSLAVCGYTSMALS